jgi:hypothetical protein
VLVALPVLFIAAAFLHTPQPPTPNPVSQFAVEPVPLSAAHPKPPARPAEAAATDRSPPAPYNGNFAANTIADKIPPQAFNSARRIKQLDTAASDDIRALQQGLKAFGLFTDPLTGVLDRPTQKSLRLLTVLTGMPATDAQTGTAALTSAQTRADHMLWILGLFPFGNSLPSWLLASLDTDDAGTLFAAFSLHADSGKPVFSVPLTAPGLIVRAHLFPDTPGNATTLTCYGFSALFERGPFRHHVISRACRDPDTVHWAMAARE